MVRRAAELCRSREPSQGEEEGACERGRAGVNAPQGERPILIVKRPKKAGSAHHGGAWKVAYADFVTAMMAFFMVMWLIGMDPTVKNSIEGYFANPVGFKKGYSAGRSPVSSGSSPSHV